MGIFSDLISVISTHKFLALVIGLLGSIVVLIVILIILVFVGIMWAV